VQVQVSFQVEAQALDGNALRGRVVDKANRQAGSQGVQNGLNGVGAGIAAQKYRWFIPFQNKGAAAGSVLLLDAVKTLNTGTRVAAANPLISDLSRL
jgi:hypothetical protein